MQKKFRRIDDAILILEYLIKDIDACADSCYGRRFEFELPDYLRRISIANALIKDLRRSLTEGPATTNGHAGRFRFGRRRPST